jgi:hypothetical protein
MSNLLLLTSALVLLLPYHRDLSENELTGRIPSELAKLTKLTTL